MTNDTSTTTSPTFLIDPGASDLGRLAGDDVRRFFATTVATAGPVIAAVEPDQFDRPTPCAEFDVRRLTGHLLAVLLRVAAVGRGVDPLSVPSVVEDVPDDAWLDRWTRAGHDVEAVWSEPGIFARQMRLPFATLPGATALTIYTGEITVHTWDLAVATDQRPSWDDTVVAVALAAAQRALTAEQRGPGVPFGPVVPVADDAPVIDRLVAWMGRRP